jgi:hypothetical protein
MNGRLRKIQTQREGWADGQKGRKDERHEEHKN